MRWGFAVVPFSVSSSVTAAISVAAASTALYFVSAVRADEGLVARYVALDGGYEILVDRDKLTATTNTIMTDVAGRSAGERLSFEFDDCSSTQLVCAEFDTYVLAVPREVGALQKWNYQGWAFQRTACLESTGPRCVRFAVRFANAAEGREGGFVFSRDRGVEMHFDANVARKEQWRIYVLASAHGLLYGGRL
jgi:hypothetical protein